MAAKNKVSVSTQPTKYQLSSKRRDARLAEIANQQAELKREAAERRARHSLARRRARWEAVIGNGPSFARQRPRLAAVHMGSGALAGPAWSTSRAVSIDTRPSEAALTQSS